MIAAILLAAGESTRMGQPKALLPWAASTLLEVQIQALCGAGIEKIIVVTGAFADQIEPIARRYPVTIAHNPRYREGRSTSIETGARSLLPGISAILLANVDQPRPASIVTQLIEAHKDSNHLISRPAIGEEHGHPTIFSAELLPELLTLSEECEGLKNVIRRNESQIQNVQFDDEMVLLNLNDPEAYELGRARFEHLWMQSAAG